MNEADLVEGLRWCSSQFVKLLILRVVVRWIVRHDDELHQLAEKEIGYDRNSPAS